MKFFKKLFVYVFLFVFLFSNFVYSTDENISNADYDIQLMSIPDTDNYRGLHENLILEKVKITKQQYATDINTGYLVFYDSKNDLYHYFCYKLSGNAKYYEPNYLYISAKNDFSIKFKPPMFEECYYFTANFSLSEVSDVNDVKFSTGGNNTIKGIVETKLGHEVDFNFTYCSLLYVSDGILLTMENINKDFENRIVVEEPALLTLDDELNTAEYLIIDPQDYYNSGVKVSGFSGLQEACQRFMLSIYKKNDEGLEDERFYTFNLDMDSIYWVEAEKLFKIPISVIKHLLTSSGNYYTVFSFTDSSNMLGNTFLYNGDSGTITGGSGHGSR